MEGIVTQYNVLLTLCWVTCFFCQCSSSDLHDHLIFWFFCSHISVFYVFYSVISLDITWCSSICFQLLVECFPSDNLNHKSVHYYQIMFLRKALWAQLCVFYIRNQFFPYSSSLCRKLSSAETSELVKFLLFLNIYSFFEKDVNLIKLLWFPLLPPNPVA